MSKEEIVLFEGNEIKVKTDKGETLVNLAHTAKCCGLIKKKKDRLYVRWTDKGIGEKLKLISSTCVEPKYKDEISYILNEINETDDRNSGYINFRVV